MTQLDTAPVTGGTRPRHHDHFIDGDWVRSSGEIIERRAPATGLLVSQVAAGTADTVDRAVAAARRAFEDDRWSQVSGFERAAVLHRVADLISTHAETLARLDAEEVGKPILVARADVAGAAQLTRYAAGLAIQMQGTTHTNNGPEHTGLVLREAAGVVGLITPWNFPALILSQKLPLALAAGCTVVVKPSELTSSSAAAIARLYAEAGLPDGVLNVVTGDGRAGAALAEHPDVDVLSFTGSTATGRRIIAASAGNLKKLSLELGGKAATVVFPDADLDAAAAGVVFGGFFNNGECCVAQSRLLVHTDIAEEFLAAVRERTAALRVGQPLDETTDVGALIHEAHLRAVVGAIDRAEEAGATVLVGGSRASSPQLAGGSFLVPTVLDGVTPQMAAFSDEIFGPVLTASRFRTTEEALALANGVDYGLSNSVWSRDIDTALPFARGLRSGSVYVNTVIDGPPTMPFGGYKTSGIGREMGQAGFEEFTELKSVSIRTGTRPGRFTIGTPPAS
ncbi:aldehyde dehydrogenase family protein [Pseudonocardia sp. CA-107938]|uniref:aldehyde dehydrogenase family protein n=1 Tax=Pseudonocardia sp. CA-107938 TaxID=3240021 RepID=UPI003D8AF615